MVATTVFIVYGIICSLDDTVKILGLSSDRSLYTYILDTHCWYTLERSSLILYPIPHDDANVYMSKGSYQDNRLFVVGLNISSFDVGKNTGPIDIDIDMDKIKEVEELFRKDTRGTKLERLVVKQKPGIKIVRNNCSCC